MTTFAESVCAQTQVNEKLRSIQNNKPIWMAKWVASSLLTPETPTLQVGLEFIPKSSQHIGIEFSYGLKCIIGDNQFDNRFDRQYSKYQLETRYYFQPITDGKLANFFLALEGFHVDCNYSKENSSYRDAGNQEYTYDFARANKAVNGFAFKAGFVFKFNFPIWVECFAGLGLRWADLQYVDVVNKTKVSVQSSAIPIYSLGDPSTNNEGLSARPHNALGVKAVYKF